MHNLKLLAWERDAPANTLLSAYNATQLLKCSQKNKLNIKQWSLLFMLHVVTKTIQLTAKVDQKIQ